MRVALICLATATTARVFAAPSREPQHAHDLRWHGPGDGYSTANYCQPTLGKGVSCGAAAKMVAVTRDGSKAELASID